MKDAKSIISHLVQHPSMEKCKQVRCFERLLGLLPKSFTCMVKFLYIKNETLFFVFNHPYAKMEFNYKQSLIKSLLSQIPLHFPECACLQVKDVQCFISNKTEEVSLLSDDSNIVYPERAQGAFENECQDEKLRTLFEAIRKAIKSHSC